MTTVLTPPQPAAATPAPAQTTAPTPPPGPAPVPAPVDVPASYRADPSVYRFTVAQYQRMVEVGILTADDKVELLDGYVVLKMSRNPPHDGTILRISKRLARFLPPGWDVRTQAAVVLPDSQPEPDVAVVREDPNDYTTRHPALVDVGFIMEVADSSLPRDRREKAELYARAGVAVYWVINLVDRRVEVYTQPSGPTAAPSYAALVSYHPGDAVPLVLDGAAVGAVPAADLLP